VLRGEVATYDQYLTGDIWGYQITNPDGEKEDSLCGLYGYDYALQEAKNMIDWLRKERTKNLRK
jgi:hypothetical protein